MARAWFVLCGCLLTVSTASAAPPKVADLGVDLVTLKSGPKLYGAVLQQGDGLLTIAVQRDWLTKAAPKFLEKREQDAAANRSRALQALQKRIQDWLVLRAADKELVASLTKESGRLEKVEPGEARRFLLIELPRTQVERVFVQTPQRKQVALSAWSQKLPAVEESSAAKLADELRRQGIDVAKPVDLTSELPDSSDSDRQWSARQALWEFHLRKSLAFQGTADLLFRTDADKPDIAKLIEELFKSQLKSQVAELLGGAPKGQVKFSDKALKTAQATADKEQASGFRVTRMAFQLEKKSVMVEGRFLAKLSDGTWETIWQHAETIDASKPRDDLEQQLAKHPEVQQVLDLAKTKGLGISDQQIQLAVRCGAATMAAQETVDAKFHEFFDRYTERLDGPALWLAPKK